MLELRAQRRNAMIAKHKVTAIEADDLNPMILSPVAPQFKRFEPHLSGYRSDAYKPSAWQLGLDKTFRNQQKMLT
jgi:hypothetical protein